MSGISQKSCTMIKTPHSFSLSISPFRSSYSYKTLALSNVFQWRQHVPRQKQDPFSHFTSPFNIPKGCKANTRAEAVKHKETKALPLGPLSYFCLGAPRCAPVTARAAPLTPPAAVTEAGRAQRGHPQGRSHTLKRCTSPWELERCAASTRGFHHRSRS